MECDNNKFRYIPFFLFCFFCFPFSVFSMELGCQSDVDPISVFCEAEAYIDFSDTSGGVDLIEIDPLGLEALGLRNENEIEMAVNQVRPGEWLEYEIEVPQPGNYMLEFHATQLLDKDIKDKQRYANFQVLLDGVELSSTQLFRIPKTLETNRYVPFRYPDITILQTGTYRLRIVFGEDSNEVRVDKLGLVLVDGANTTPVSVPQYLNAPIMRSNFSSEQVGSPVTGEVIADIFGHDNPADIGTGTHNIDENKHGVVSTFDRLAVVERNGSYWLQQTYSHRETRLDGGEAQNYNLGWTGTQFSIPIPTPNGPNNEIYLSFDIEFPIDNVLTRGGKMGPGLTGKLSGSPTPTGGVDSDGRNFAIRNYFTERLFLSSRHPNSTGMVSGVFANSGPGNDGTRNEDFIFTRNAAGTNVNDGYHPKDSPIQWKRGLPIRMQIRMRMNTSTSAANGILQVWQDGELVVDRDDLLFRTDGNLYIEDFFYSTFFGGNNVSNATFKEEKVWFTNIALSNSPLICDPNIGEPCFPFPDTGVNANPILTSPGNQTNVAGDVGVSIPVVVTDADGDAVLLSVDLNTLPPGITFDDSIPAFTGSPSQAGSYGIMISADDSRGGTDSVTFNWVVSAQVIEVAPIRLEAEAWDSFFKARANQGETTPNVISQDGGQVVNGIDHNDWLSFSVAIPVSGDYAVDMRYARGGSPEQVSFELNGIDLTGQIDVNPTLNWSTWETHEITTLSLSAGTHDLKVIYDGGINTNWFELTLVETQ